MDFGVKCLYFPREILPSTESRLSRDTARDAQGRRNDGKLIFGGTVKLLTLY